MSTAEEEQLRKHHEKWKKWNQEIQHNKQAGFRKQEDAHSYAVKLIQKLQDPKDQTVIVRHSEKNVDQQVNNNQCCVCDELMVLPNKPITLFPCAHNICQVCLFNSNSSGKNRGLRIEKCPICRQTIQGHAENRALMDLISTYTDNRHLISETDREQVKVVQRQKVSKINHLRIRCSILEGELADLDRQLNKHTQSNNSLQKVISEMETEKQRNVKELVALREQACLIDKFLKEKESEIKKMQGPIEATEKKLKVVKNALDPLRVQMEKKEILEAAKLLEGQRVYTGLLGSRTIKRWQLLNSAFLC